MKTPRKSAPKWTVPSKTPSVHSPSENPAPKVKWVKASSIEPEEIDWLWYPYIPASSVTSIEGDPGVGKSWLTCAIASAISTGRPLPGQRPGRVPNRVIMLNGEDSLEHTIVPRLIAMEANLDNIIFPDRAFTLTPEGISTLEEQMRSATATIVFIDPIQLFLGSKIDMNRANEVRGFMDGLMWAARRTKSAVIIVRHLRKAGSGTAIYRGLGSIDFTASVRSVLQVSREDDGAETRLVRHEKSNYEKFGYDFTYTIEDGKFIWGQQGARLGVSTTKKSSKAKAFLTSALAAGPVAASEMSALAADAGIHWSTLVRAKPGLVESVKVGDAWFWSLSTPPSVVNGAAHASGG